MNMTRKRKYINKNVFNKFELAGEEKKKKENIWKLKTDGGILVFVY